MKNYASWLLLFVLAFAVFGSVAPVVYAQANPPPEVNVTAGGPPRQKVLLTEGMENVFWHAMRILRCLYWAAIVSHLLFALLVFLDIKQRGKGSMLFVLLTLIGGVLAAGVYALFRMGDAKA